MPMKRQQAAKSKGKRQQVGGALFNLGVFKFNKTLIIAFSASDIVIMMQICQLLKGKYKRRGE